MNILSENAREKLTAIAKKVNLSVDSTKKRVEKLERDGVITKYTIQVNPDRYGLPLAVHVYLKLKDVTKESYGALVAEMMKNQRVIDLMGMLGDYDLYIVFLAKNTQEMECIKIELRQKFGGIIGEWKEVIVSRLYKLEEYRF